LLGRLLEEAALGTEAGVGERGVHAAEALERRLDQRLLIIELRDVTALHERALLAQLAGQLAQRLLRTRGEHHVPSVGHGGARGGGADAGARSCDEKDARIGHARVSSTEYCPARDGGAADSRAL